MRTVSDADIVVIGGGVIGTSAAMNLARMGVGNKVVLVEREHLASGASGLSGAMIREHYLHPVLVRMAMESKSIFENFGDTVGGDAGFKRTGRLLLFPEQDEPAVLANVKMNRDLGVNIETMSPTRASRLATGMDISGIAVCAYEPEAGYADPIATNYAYAARARESGAVILTGTPVVKLMTSEGTDNGSQDGIRQHRSSGRRRGHGPMVQSVSCRRRRDATGSSEPGSNGTLPPSAVS